MRATPLLFAALTIPTTSYAWSQHGSMSFSPTTYCFRTATRIITKDFPTKRLPRSTTSSSWKHNHQVSSCRYQPSSPTRLFGSKAGIPGNPPGDIVIENVQDVLPNIDQERLRANVEKIRDMIGYPTYDVNLYLVEDKLMQETNRDSRGMDQPTDILSFQFHLHKEAGVLQEPDFDIPDYYTLGEMLIDVPYVIRRCQEDKAIMTGDYHDDDDDDASIEEDDDEDERGVSGAMATVYDPEERINMLLVHGMLHLVGHDHEEDDEFERMVSKEEEILNKLGMLSSQR